MVDELELSNTMIYLLSISAFCCLLLVGCASAAKREQPPLPWEAAAVTANAMPQAVIPPGGTGKPFTLVWNYSTNVDFPARAYWLQSSPDCQHWSNVLPIDGHTTMLIRTNNKPCEFFRFVTQSPDWWVIK